MIKSKIKSVPKKLHVKTGDTVVVISGRSNNDKRSNKSSQLGDKGKIGKVLNFIYIPVSVPKKYFVEVEYIEYKKIEVSKEEYEKIKIGEKKDFNVNEKELETYIINLK